MLYLRWRRGPICSNLAKYCRIIATKFAREGVYLYFLDSNISNTPPPPQKLPWLEVGRTRLLAASSAGVSFSTDVHELILANQVLAGLFVLALANCF